MSRTPFKTTALLRYNSCSTTFVNLELEKITTCICAVENNPEGEEYLDGVLAGMESLGGIQYIDARLKLRW